MPQRQHHLDGQALAQPLERLVLLRRVVDIKRMRGGLDETRAAPEPRCLCLKANAFSGPFLPLVPIDSCRPWQALPNNAESPA